MVVSQGEEAADRSILVPGEMGFVAQAAVAFASDEVADAKFGEVGGITLIDLFEGKVFFLDLIVAELESFAVVHCGGGEGTAVGIDSNAEFPGGRFVVGDEETAANAGAIDEVHVQRAVAGRSVDATGDPSAEGQLAGDGLGVFLEAIEEAGALVEKNKKEGGAGSTCDEVPEAMAERAKKGKSEDGTDEG